MKKQITIKENQDLEYSSFLLHKNGLTPVGQPTYEQWQEVGEFIRKAEGSVHFWIGDWLNYGEGKWGEMYTQALDHTNFDYGTLRNDKYIADQIDLSLRSDNLTRAHAQELAPLPQEQKEQFAKELAEEYIPVKDLKDKVKAWKKTLLVEPVIPEGEFNVIYADPPWEYDFSETTTREIENHYPTMSVEEICALDIPSADNTVLFLWATAPKLREALKVMEAWGFEYKTNLTWDKEKIGMGYWFRGQHELLLIGTKGSINAPEESVRASSVYREARTEHSKKPDYFYDLIESYFPDGKYLEYFARQKHSDKWEVVGNQL